MILVDTSVWVNHLRESDRTLEGLLHDGDVACHPFVIGELACGNLKRRAELLALLKALPVAARAEDEEVLAFIENHRLMGKGLGYIDMHLLASAQLSEVSLWTQDKRLSEVAATMGLTFGKR